MNRETVGPKKNLKMITNRKEKQLNQVINGVKKQIDKLCLIIKMTCNSVACNDNLIKSVDDQLDEINNEVESEIQEVENSNKRRLENSSKDDNQNEKARTESSKKCRVRAHPHSRNQDDTGNIKCVRFVKDANVLNQKDRSTNINQNE